MLLQSAGKLKTLLVSFGQIRDKSSGKSAEENFQSNFFNSFQKTDNSDQNLKLNFNGRRFLGQPRKKSLFLRYFSSNC